jgi:hypothetical protein
MDQLFRQSRRLYSNRRGVDQESGRDLRGFGDFARACA